MVVFVDLKQIDCQMYLQQKWVYLGSAENCNSGSATRVSHVQAPPGQGKDICIAEKRKLGGLRSTESMAFPG